MRDREREMRSHDDDDDGCCCCSAEANNNACLFVAAPQLLHSAFFCFIRSIRRVQRRQSTCFSRYTSARLLNPLKASSTYFVMSCSYGVCCSCFGESVTSLSFHANGVARVVTVGVFLSERSLTKKCSKCFSLSSNESLGPPNLWK